MPVEAACPSCEGKFRLPDAAAGKKIRCPKCKGPLDVPPLTAAPEPAAVTTPGAPVAEGIKDAWRAAPPQPAVVPPTAPAPAAPKSAATTSTLVAKPKAVEFKLPETTPEPVKRTEPKPAETRPVETKPIVFKPSEPPPEQWFLRGDDGETYGPVDRPTLNAWHAEGRMTADSQLLKQGNEQWQWASDLYPDLDEPEEPASPVTPAPESAGSSIHRDEVESASATRTGGRSAKGSASQSRRTMSDVEPDADAETGERLSPHRKPVAFLLALTLGMFGIHRFYLGYVGIGLAMFFTFGGLLMWSLTDALRILFGHVTDAEGLKLRD